MGLMKKLTSSIVASSLVLGLVGSALAAPTADQTNDAFGRLSHYGIAKGKLGPNGTIDPALGEPITRAELVTIVARAFGQENTAKILQGAASFSDVEITEWYSGYVALAKNMAEKSGFELGYGDGTFKPAKNVSNVEALAFIMKFLGVKPGTGATWAEDTIKAAIEAGVITSADAETYVSAPNAEANRGAAFGLADTVFAGYNKLASGKSVYRTYVDTEAPVVSLDKVDATTTNTTVKLSGKITGDYIAAMIGTEKITINEDGTFAAEVKLEVGENTINVIAIDRVGNEGVGTISIKRTAGAAAKVEVTPANAQISVKGETEVEVKVVDANGAKVDVPAADIKVVVAEGMGTYAEGKFTASEKAGKATITATYGDFTAAGEVEVQPGPLAKIGTDKPSAAPGGKIQLTGQDEFGNAIASGVEFSIDSADAFVVNGAFVGTKAGTYEVTAKQGDKTATLKIGVYESDANRLAIEAPASIIANDASAVEVKVKAIDKNGNLVGDYNSNITLWADGEVIKAASGSLTTKATNGVATFKIKTQYGSSIGGSTIELFASAEDLEEGKGEIEAVAQVATKVDIKSAPEYVASTPAGIQFGKIQAQVVDQAGKRMLSGTHAVKFTLTGPGYFTDEAGDMNYGAEADSQKTYVGESSTYAETYVKASAGQTGVLTVTATIEGLGTVTKDVKVAVPTTVAAIKASVEDSPGRAGKFENGTGLAVTVELQLVDTNGVPMPAPDNLTSVFVDSNKSNSTLKQIQVKQDDTLVLYADADANKKQTHIEFDELGQATLTVNAAKFTGDLELTVKDIASSNPLTSAVAKLAFDANKAAQFGLASGNKYVTMKNPTGTVEVQLYDEAGNKAKVAGKEIIFTRELDGAKIDGTNKAEVKKVTNAEGIASIQVTMPKIADTFPGVISVDSDEYALLGTNDTVGFTVGYAVPSTMTARVVEEYTDANNVKKLKSAVDKSADDLVQLFVQVKDSDGAIMNNDSLSSFGLSSESADLVKGTLKWTYKTEHNGWLSDPVQVTKAGSNSITVVSKDADDLSGIARVSIKAGALKSYVVKEAVEVPGFANEVILVSNNKLSGPFTFQGQDEYGNLVVNTTGAKIPVSIEAILGNGESPYIDLRTSAGGRNVLVGNTGTIEIPVGASSVTFYLLASPGKGATKGGTITITVTTKDKNNVPQTHTTTYDLKF